MNDADLDILIYLHKRFTDAKEPLTPEDIAYITGRIEQVLKENGVLDIDHLAGSTNQKRKFPRNLLP